jgi:soluble lytic murein transglycosylase
MEVPDAAVDETVRAWRIRTALADADWAAVAKHIEALPQEEAQKEEWRYWHAVALDKTDRHNQAMDEFAQLAKLRDYHGFLAADQLSWPYEMSDQPVEYTEESLQHLAQQPRFVRARELYRAEMLLDARREWEQAIQGMPDTELKLAAVLAQQWGWHDCAILTVARSGDYDDLALRFPLSFSEAVQGQARARQLDPAHVYAVIRQESAFNKDARSHAGAMGLMQLMPKTGSATARKYGIPLGSMRNLFEPEKNISIGSAYLRQVMEQYDNSIVLASAAYNAGPHRVRRWLPETRSLSAASWIALIPFTETRKYVQRVLAYAAIYDWRMQREITPLRKHMPMVMPRSHRLATAHSNINEPGESNESGNHLHTRRQRLRRHPPRPSPGAGRVPGAHTDTPAATPPRPRRESRHHAGRGRRPRQRGAPLPVCRLQHGHQPGGHPE